MAENKCYPAGVKPGYRAPLWLKVRLDGTVVALTNRSDAVPQSNTAIQAVYDEHGLPGLRELALRSYQGLRYQR